MSKTPLTVRGEKMLRDELNDLKTVQRPKVIQAIAEARAHGDLKENAEYHAAREQQGFIEGRIQHLEYSISHAQVIDVEKGTSTLTLTIDRPGLVDVEEHDSGRVVLQLEVRLQKRRRRHSSPSMRARRSSGQTGFSR